MRCEIDSGLEKVEKGMEMVEQRRLETRARQTPGMRGDGKRKSNRYDHTLARAEGSGPTRFGKRIQIGGFWGSTGKVHRMRRQRID